MALPGDVTTFTLKFGEPNGYTDATGALALVGAEGYLFTVDPSTDKPINVKDSTTGHTILPKRVPFTIGSDGKASVTPVPHTGQARHSPAGWALRAEWKIPSGDRHPSPKNLTFVVPSGAIAYYDSLVPAATVPAVAISVPGIPSGGTTGQVLAKASNADRDTAWVPQTGGAGGGAVASVNGQVGAVVLNAGHVGAQPAGDYATNTALTTGLAAKVDTTDPRLTNARTPTAHTHPIADLTATGTRDSTTFLRGDGTWSPTPAAQGAAEATPTVKGLVKLAGDLGGTADLPTVPGLAGKADTAHTHAAANVSDSTPVGRSVLTAADATAARTAIGAGTSSLAIGTSGTTAAAGNDARLADTRTPTDSSVTNVKVAAAAAINADKLADGTTNKLLTATERTKLTGIATGATANSTDATLLARANHTGTQAATTITGLATVATTGAYADLSGKPTIPAALTVQDEAVALTQRAAINFVGAGVTATDDAANGRTVVTIPGGGGGAASPTPLGAYAAHMYVANEDEGGNFTPAPDVIALCPLLYPVQFTVKKVTVHLATAATAAAPYGLGVYDSTGALVASFGTLDLAGTVGSITLTLAGTASLSGLCYLAGKLLAASASGGALRIGNPFPPLRALVSSGNPWDPLVGGMALRGQSIPHPGTGALPATLPTGQTLTQGERVPLVGFQPS